MASHTIPLAGTFAPGVVRGHDEQLTKRQGCFFLQLAFMV